MYLIHSHGTSNGIIAHRVLYIHSPIAHLKKLNKNCYMYKRKRKKNRVHKISTINIDQELKSNICRTEKEKCSSKRFFVLNFVFLSKKYRPTLTQHRRHIHYFLFWFVSLSDIHMFQMLCQSHGLRSRNNARDGILYMYSFSATPKKNIHHHHHSVLFLLLSGFITIAFTFYG